MTCTYLDKIINFLLNLSMSPMAALNMDSTMIWEILSSCTCPTGGHKQPYGWSIWQYSLFFLWFSCITTLPYCMPQHPVLCLALPQTSHFQHSINELATEAALNHVLFLLKTPCTFLYSFCHKNPCIGWRCRSPTCPKPDPRVATRPLPRPLYFWYLVQFETYIVVTVYLSMWINKASSCGSVFSSRQSCTNISCRRQQNRLERRARSRLRETFCRRREQAGWSTLVRLLWSISLALQLRRGVPPMP